MSTKALCIRHKALPGKRDEVKRIWEKYARAYIDNAAGHVVYIYSFDDSDPDTIVAYQLHNGEADAEDFASQPWYQDYERETAELLAGPSEFRTLTPQWIKGGSAWSAIHGRRRADVPPPAFPQYAAVMTLMSSSLPVT